MASVDEPKPSEVGHTCMLHMYVARRFWNSQKIWAPVLTPITLLYPFERATHVIPRPGPLSKEFGLGTGKRPFGGAYTRAGYLDCVPYLSYIYRARRHSNIFFFCVHLAYVDGLSVYVA